MSSFALVLKNPPPVDAAAMWPAREKRVHVPYECGLCPPACSPARPPCCSPPRPPVPPVKILRTLFDRCRKVLVRPCAPDSNSGFFPSSKFPHSKKYPPRVTDKKMHLCIQFAQEAKYPHWLSLLMPNPKSHFGQKVATPRCHVPRMTKAATFPITSSSATGSGSGDGWHPGSSPYWWPDGPLPARSPPLLCDPLVGRASGMLWDSP